MTIIIKCPLGIIIIIIIIKITKFNFHENKKKASKCVLTLFKQ